MELKLKLEGVLNNMLLIQDSRTMVAIATSATKIKPEIFQLQRRKWAAADPGRFVITVTNQHARNVRKMGMINIKL